MKTFEYYLKIEENNAASDIDLELLEKQLETFRKNIEKENNWRKNKICFQGTCQDITIELNKYLSDLGYKAKRVGGYYTNADDNYYPDTSNWDFDDIEEFDKKYNKNGESSNGLKFKHWWLELNNKYIIDLTEDQFHPGEEDYYRIGIYTKPDSSYKKVMISEAGEFDANYDNLQTTVIDPETLEEIKDGEFEITNILGIITDEEEIKKLDEASQTEFIYNDFFNKKLKVNDYIYLSVLLSPLNGSTAYQNGQPGVIKCRIIDMRRGLGWLNRVNK